MSHCGCHIKKNHGQDDGCGFDIKEDAKGAQAETVPESIDNMKYADTYSLLELIPIIEICTVNGTIETSSARLKFYPGDISFVIVFDEEGYEKERWNLNHIVKIKWDEKALREFQLAEMQK